MFGHAYSTARAAFLNEAKAQRLQVESVPHPLRGASGEELALDIARDGPDDAARLLIVSSGCHGIEGPAGSAVQRALLADAALRAQARGAGIALLYLHALNPHGWSHQRRVTHENVDLNRNFHDFRRPLPVNEAYRALHPLLLPARWPPGAGNAARIGWLLATRGMRTLQQAVSGGQYEFAGGLFFGGHAPTWNNRVLRAALRRHGAAARHIAWVDMHTGLGPRGVGERIWSGGDDAAGIARARQWWDGGGRTPVTSLIAGSSSSARLTGVMCPTVMADECPHAAYTGVGLEFGTVSRLRVLQALRGDHWLHLHGQEVPPPLATSIHAAMRAAFAPQDDAWGSAVLAQGRQVLRQAVLGLAQTLPGPG